MYNIIVEIYNAEMVLLDRKMVTARNSRSAFRIYEKRYGKINTKTDWYKTILVSLA